MVNKKEVVSFFRDVKQRLKEDFESRYGFTDQKRKIDQMISAFPNGVEVLIFNIKKIHDSQYSMVIKYNANNMDSALKYHGYHTVKNVRNLEKLILKVYDIKWRLDINEYVISTNKTYKDSHYIYVKNKDPLTDTISILYNFYIIHNFWDLIELSVRGVDDEIHSVELNNMIKGLRRFARLPKDKSFAIFDLPFELKLTKSKYKFTYRGKEGEIRLVNLRAMYGDGRPPLMGMICSIPFTRVAIIYPFNKKSEHNETIMTSINIMNEIIEAYRVVTNRYYIPNISMNDIKESQTYIHGGESAVSAKIRDSFSEDFKYKEEDIKAEEYSPTFGRYLSGKKVIPLQRRFIINSKRHFYYQNYQYSVFEAVLALEIATSQVIREKYYRLNITKGKVDDFINRTGNKLLLTCVIPTLISKQKKEELETLLPKCIKAIQTRNKIAHQGSTDVKTKEVVGYIKAIEAAIDILES